MTTGPDVAPARFTRRSAGEGAQAGLAVHDEQGVVHLEELRSLGPARQPQRARQRTAPGVPGRPRQVVVELAGQEDLVRGGLDLGDELVGTLGTAEGGPE